MHKGLFCVTFNTMVKQKSSPSLRNLIFTLIAIIVLTLGSILYRYFTKPVGINVIGEAGNSSQVTLSGILQKDTPVGVKGDYFLILESGNSTKLQAANLDEYISSQVVVEGNFLPLTASTEQIFVVNKVTQQ